MKIKNISISLGRTINLGNFNSIRTEISIEADVVTEDYESSIDELNSVAEYNLEKIIRKRIQKTKSTSIENYLDEDFIGD